MIGWLRLARAMVRLLAGNAPNWYGAPGSTPKYEYSYGRQNWFEANAEECKAVREAVGLFDQSSFAKFRLEGRDACAVLNRVCANDVDVAPGKLIYTQWLNEKGGIEADLTVTRLSQTTYLIVTGAETETKVFQLAVAAYSERVPMPF